jgi:hypothetical protein
VFSYQTPRGYTYRIDLLLARPQPSVELGDPGKVIINVDSSWATARITNDTASRDAPLGTNPGDVLAINAWVKFPKSLAADVIADQACNPGMGPGPYGNCVVPPFISISAHLALVAGTTIPSGGEVSLQPAGTPDLPDAYALANDRTISEVHEDAWTALLASMPTYYVVMVAPGGFGNNPVSGGGYADYTCQNSMLPIIAVFDGRGNPIDLTSGGCALAQKLESTH